jgi:hypothetical protein
MVRLTDQVAMTTTIARTGRAETSFILPPQTGQDELKITTIRLYDALHTLNLIAK